MAVKGPGVNAKNGLFQVKRGDVVQEDHQIDHWSIVLADVKQHARKRTIWVVRVHTLRGTVASLV